LDEIDLAVYEEISFKVKVYGRRKDVPTIGVYVLSLCGIFPHKPVKLPHKPVGLLDFLLFLLKLWTE
jgi:hypothetical protein